MAIRNGSYGIGCVLGALGAYGLLLILRSEPSMGWGGDDTMYILNTQALLGSGHYAENGYVFNPHAPHIGPPFYPPGTAALLLPAYAVWGFNLKALSGLLTIYGIGALMLAYAFFARASSRRIALLSVAVVAVNPYFLHFTSIVESEFPFMLWLYAAFLMLSLRDAARSRSAILASSAAAGLCAYLAYATREVGALLIPAIVMHDLVRGEAPWKRTLPAVLVFSMGAACQHWLLPDKAGYAGIVLREIADVYRQGVGVPLWNVRNYADSFREFFPGPFHLDVLVGAAALLGIGWGMGLRVRSRFAEARRDVRAPSIVTVMRAFPIDVLYVLGTVLLLISMPRAAEGGARYLFPLLPLLVWYALIPLESAAVTFARYAGAGVLVGYSIASLLAPSFFGIDSRPAEGPLSAQAQEAFGAVASYAGRDRGIVVFSKPRALVLFAHCRAIAWPADGTGRETVEFLRDARLRYVLITRGGENLRQPDGVAEVLRRETAIELFANQKFALYRLARASLSRGSLPLWRARQRGARAARIQASELRRTATARQKLVLIRADVDGSGGHRLHVVVGDDDG